MTTEVTTHLVAFHADVGVVTLQTLDATGIEGNTLMTAITCVALIVIRILLVQLLTERSVLCAVSYQEPWFCEDFELEGIHKNTSL